MKILVTGGGGFVGKNLVKKLIDLKHEVMITAMGSEKIKLKVKKILYASFEGIDWKSICGLDAVIHLAANNDTRCQDESEMYRANVYAPITLFHRAYYGGCRNFVYASSTAVYGNESAPYHEDSTEINPLNPYGRSKAAFDEFSKKFSEEKECKVIGLRYCNVYGPGEEKKEKRMSMIRQLINQMLADKPPMLFKHGEQKRDWIFVDDVVEANLLALKCENSGIFNTGTGVATSFNRLVEIINQHLETNHKPNYIRNSFEDEYQNHTECNIEKAQKELNFKAKFDIENGIKTYIDRIKNSPLI